MYEQAEMGSTSSLYPEDSTYMLKSEQRLGMLYMNADRPVVHIIYTTRLEHVPAITTVVGNIGHVSFRKVYF